MKDKIQTFIIAITISEFGNLAKFYKTYAKGNREIIVEQIEHEGEDEQHNSGILKEKIVCRFSQLKDKVQEFVDKNSLQQECFNVTLEGKAKTIMTEDDL